MSVHPAEKLWRKVGLPEYFLGNGGSNTKLYEFYDAIVEICAKTGEKAWPLGDYPIASENTELYQGQDHTARTVVKAIRALAVSRPASNSEAK
jgi:hypothetical protein